MKLLVGKHWKGILASVLIATCFIGIGIRSRDFVVCRIAEYFLRSSGGLPTDLTVRCASSSISLRELSCKQFTVNSPSDAQFEIHADACIISFFSKPKTIYPSPHVTLSGLSVTLPNKIPEGKQKKFSLKKIRTLYSLGSFLTIESGIVNVNQDTSLHFSFADHEEGRSLIVNHPTSGVHPLFTLMISQEGKALHMKASCNELDIRSVGALSLFTSKNIVLKEGVIDGKFSSVLSSNNQLEKTAYGVSVKNLLAEFGTFQVGAGEFITFRGAENPGKSIFDAEWQLSSCFVNKKEEGGKITHVVKDVRAILPARSGEMLTVKGAMKHWRGFHPFHIHGMRTISTSVTELELKLNAEPFEVGCDISYDPQGSGSIKCDFSQCDSHFISLLLKEKIAQLFPANVEMPTIKRGFFTGSAYARLHRWKLDTLEVEQLSLEKFALEIGTLPGGVIGDEVQCFFRYTDSGVPSWGVHLQNISLPAANITKCTGDFAIHERYVIPSTLQANIDSCVVKASVRGVLPSVKLSLETSGGCAALFNTVLPNHSLTADELSAILSMSVRSTLQIHEQTWNIRGVLSALSLAHSDKIDFQCNMMRPRGLDAKGIRDAIREVTFAGRNTSSLMINLPLGIAGQPWRLRGKTSFEGGITGQDLRINFKQPNLSFHSPVLSIAIDKAQKDASIAYNLEENKWTGTLSASGASVTLPKTGLHFSNATGEVTIEGKEVYIREMSAFYDDLCVEGRMMVHFPVSDDVNIELITTGLYGKVDTLQNILRHFDDFKTVSFPVVGMVTQEEGKGLRLKANLKDEDNILQWGADLRIVEGTYHLSEAADIEQLSLDIQWDGTSGDLVVSNLNGIIQSELMNGEPLLIRGTNFSIKDDVIDTFSLRIDNGTYDVALLQGALQKKDGVYHLNLDKENAHVYSVPLDTAVLTFDESYSIQRGLFDTQVSIPQIKRIAQLASLFNVTPFGSEIDTFLSNYTLKCDPNISIQYDKEKQVFTLGASADEVTFNGKNLGKGKFTLQKEKAAITECSLNLSSLHLQSSGSWLDEEIKLDTIEIKRKKAYAKLSAFTYSFGAKTMHCVIDKVYGKLEELKNDLPSFSKEYEGYLTGALTCTGELTVDVSNGFKKPIISGSADLIAPKIGKGNLQLVSHHPLSFHIDLEEGIKLENVELHLSTLENEKHWAQLECAQFLHHFRTGDCYADGMHALIPPEMVFFIAQTESIPFVTASEHSLQWYGVELPWDNQVDISASIKYTGGNFTFDGSVKDGYYWVGNTSLFISDVLFGVGKESAKCSATINTNKQPVGIALEANFTPSLTARLTVEDKRTPEERLNDSRTTVTALFAEDSNGKMNIKSIQGGIFGVDVSFQQQSRRTTDSELVLSGKIRCHMPFLATVLPEAWQEIVETLGMGKGYEVSGDVTLDWDDLHRSTFAGYIKGKNFELLNARIQTLMGTLRISSSELSIDRFIISDEAGQLTINEIQCIRGEDNKWRLSVPQISLSDFRPSLLRYIGKYRGKMKPLVVREMHFNDITGELGNLPSFTGNGSLAFTNTFKKEYNLLDIPFELIARLGIDMGLLVPIRGKLDYEIRDGKIYFTDLRESCSEGKRSKFYLSKNSPSYISLQGDVNVSIKMKQYVILKVTEPFILSITGSVKKPKYSLR